MKQLVIMMVLFASLGYAQQPDDFQPATTNVWGAEYPRVDARGECRFESKRRTPPK